jgi:hypothetical protein
MCEAAVRALQAGPCPFHKSSNGLLDGFVADKNDLVVRYALAGHSAPLAVARYDLLPTSTQTVLPSEGGLEAALSGLERSP